MLRASLGRSPAQSLSSHFAELLCDERFLSFYNLPARARRPQPAMGTAVLGDGHGNRGGDGRGDEHGYRGHKHRDRDYRSGRGDRNGII